MRVHALDARISHSSEVVTLLGVVRVGHLLGDGGKCSCGHETGDRVAECLANAALGRGALDAVSDVGDLAHDYSL